MRFPWVLLGTVFGAAMGAIAIPIQASDLSVFFRPVIGGVGGLCWGFLMEVLTRPTHDN
jgi:hypothetical protein